MRSPGSGGLLGSVRGSKGGAIDIDRVPIRGSGRIWSKHLRGCGRELMRGSSSREAGPRGQIGTHRGCPCAVKWCVGSQGHWDGRVAH